MTRDDILRMAREAKLPDPMVFYASIERFAALVAAAEREECAKICEDMDLVYPGQGAIRSATAIRARSNTWQKP